MPQSSRAVDISRREIRSTCARRSPTVHCTLLFRASSYVRLERRVARTTCGSPLHNGGPMRMVRGCGITFITYCLRCSFMRSKITNSGQGSRCGTRPPHANVGCSAGCGTKSFPQAGSPPYATPRVSAILTHASSARRRVRAGR